MLNVKNGTLILSELGHQFCEPIAIERHKEILFSSCSGYGNKSTFVGPCPEEAIQMFHKFVQYLNFCKGLNATPFMLLDIEVQASPSYPPRAQHCTSS